jgi:RsmE family RNA methyltransferase
MIIAAKQSWNTWIPELNKPEPFSEIISSINGFAIVADQNGTPFEALALPINPPLEKISCCIGPPGGFSDEELSEMKTRNFVSLNLSPYRLRTELAATILAGAILQKCVLRGESI